jgi:hypothetical protein
MCRLQSRIIAAWSLSVYKDHEADGGGDAVFGTKICGGETHPILTQWRQHGSTEERLSRSIS